MKTGPRLYFGLVVALGLVCARAQESPAERELIQDNHFRRGFILWETRPGKHLRYGELSGLEPKAKPIWGLSQWSSKLPLANAGPVKNPGGVLVYSNSAKAITLGPPDTAKADFSMAVNAGVEYGTRARQAGEPWVHLLVEQAFDPPPALRELSRVKLHIEARLLRSRRLPAEGYSPHLHAAQFQIFFTVQNRNRRSRGYGDLVWFGVPIYDDRSPFSREHKAQDTGGTGKFIFSPGGETFSSASLHDGQWVVIEKDLLPLMREALETAWARGFLPDSKRLADYHISGMNMGWELPGIFDVEMQVRNLSLKIARDTGSPK